LNEWRPTATMLAMDPLAFLIANNATRNRINGAEPWDRPRRRLRNRPAHRAERIR
jgi:hypothetical protein